MERQKDYRTKREKGERVGNRQMARQKEIKMEIWRDRKI